MMSIQDEDDALKARLLEIQGRIKHAVKGSSRDPASVRLLAVSKRVPVARVAEAVHYGQLLFGESYAQELVIKKREFSEPVQFHLIGALQRNKASIVVGQAALIHSVDRVRLAKDLNRAAEKLGVKQAVLLQVNISGEEAKSGIACEQLPALGEEVAELSSLELRGLMAIGQDLQGAQDLALRRKEFSQLRELRDNLSQRLGLELPELSMGMSDDFEVAIQEGATIIRVGSAIFGQRT